MPTKAIRITIEAEPKEIAALVVALQERQKRETNLINVDEISRAVDKAYQKRRTTHCKLDLPHV